MSNPAPSSPLGKGTSVREALLQAALRRFARQGYHGTSMRQIARDVGTTPSNIYNYFPNKESLFAAVLDAYHPYRAVLRLLEQSAGADLETFIRQAVARIQRIIQERPEWLHLALIEMVEFQGRHSAALYRALLPRIEALARRLRDYPDLRPLSPLSMLRAFLGLIWAHYLLAHADPQAVSAPPEDLITVFLHGVLRREPRSEVTP